MNTCENCIHGSHCSICDVMGDDFCCVGFKDRSKFVELPCKVGDTVYYFVNDNLSEYCEVSVAGFHIDKYRIAFEIEVSGRKFFVDTEFLGEKVFLTKEEAEQALAEGSAKQ